MNKIILLLIGVTVIGAAAFAGFFTPPKPKSNTPAIATNTACLDEGAPITTDTVSYQGAQYNLVKSDAHVKEPGKFKEMHNTGAVDKDGYGIYTMGSDFLARRQIRILFLYFRTKKFLHSRILFLKYI